MARPDDERGEDLDEDLDGLDEDLDDELDEDFAGLPAPAPAVAPAFGTGEVPDGYRSGFACFVGRPNVGKSTLTNALVGQKIVITSDKPQTTRTVVRGIVHRPDGQLVLVDTPGLHRPRTLLGERLNDLVRTTWAEVDVVAVCFPADERIGPGDTFLVNELAKVRRTTKIAVATKTDLAAPDRIAEHLVDIAELGRSTGTEWTEIVPVSSVGGDQIDLLAQLLVGLMPEGPPLYPDGDLTDAPEEVLAAELIREAALDGVRDELPHSIAVVVEEMGLREGRPDDKPLLDIHANLFVERDSQKGIVIGRKGARLRRVGTVARQQIEALLGTPVFLDLHVKVAKDWQRDPRQLRRLGF
ncbi:GTPase Era [Nocardioides sp. SYSU DS0651]|uniref:GTPase Era n=1 Tax=Nocardioides sp. SYSU DS0651 TaxID=3415955 RepID=UPI003F4B5200